MATLVRIRGLTRGGSAVSDGSATGGSYRGFRIKSGLGQRFDAGAKATLSIGAGNAGVKYDAKYGGTWAHQVRVAHIDPTGNNVPLSVAVSAASGLVDITVTLATDGTSTITSTAAQVAAAVNAHAGAAQYVTASLLGTGATAAVAAAVAPLASGTDVGTGAPLYVRVNNKVDAVVDVDDAVTARELRRNDRNFISLGAF